MLGVQATVLNRSLLFAVLVANKKNRLVNKRSGVDVKHNSYERYLARKKGYVFQQQSC